MLNKLRRHKGLVLIIFALVFNLIETLYFGRNTAKGFNWFPNSAPELMCDTIVFILGTIGFYIIINKK